MSPKPALKLLAAAGLAALALTACGRRGALEPPQGAAPVKASTAVNGPRTLPDGIGLGGGTGEPEASAVRSGDELALSAVPPSGTEAPVETSRGAKRGYRIPKEPFILDPLL